MERPDDLDQQIHDLREKLESLQAASDQRMAAYLHSQGIYTLTQLREKLGEPHGPTPPALSETPPAAPATPVAPAVESDAAPAPNKPAAPAAPRPAPTDLSFNALLLQVPLMAKTIRQIVTIVEERTAHRFPRDLQRTLFFTKDFDLPLFTYIKNNILSDYDPGQDVTMTGPQLQAALTYAAHANDRDDGSDDAPAKEKTALAAKQGTPAPQPAVSTPLSALRSVETTPLQMTSITRPAPAPRRPLANPRALVERKLAGATAGGRYISESLVRTLHLSGGETVEIVPKEGDDLPYFKILKPADSSYHAPIHRLTFIPAEEDENGQLVLKHAYTQAPLVDPGTGETFEFIVDPHRYPLLHAGQLVDFAWYEGQDPRAGKIYWIHPLEESAPLAPRPVSTPVKKAIKKPVEEPAEAEKAAESETLQFDLNGGTVLIVGAPKHDGNVIAMLKQHGGQLTHFDAKSNAYSQLPTMIRHADYVILIPTAASHHSAQTAVSLAKRYERPFAVANTLSVVNVERAVYRAVNGLPARSVSQQDTYLESAAGAEQN
ncbi:DUF2325 domain-containing protein [Schleiferilactobacillus harbinensis]|uniref:DUF2325 domain-containing protein n=1 Tax=Schleiferilactobacillus harbinensis TaxID=304207 RepID=UPI0039EBD8E0